MTTETLTLTAFVLERIAEDEAVARAASIGNWQATPWAPKRDGFCVEVNMWAVADSALETDAQHIARHDPARVLAECKARRAIVELHAGQYSGCDDISFGDQSTCPELRALASVYVDHPAFDSRWAL